MKSPEAVTGGRTLPWGGPAGAWMRVLTAAFIFLLALGLGGCSSQPEKEQKSPASGTLLGKSGEYLTAQGRRMADFAGSLAGSQDQKRFQEEVDALFGQPLLDPLTRYLEEHSGDEARATYLAKVASERDSRCQAIAKRYAGEAANPQNLQRMQRGYLYSCPGEVKTFASRVDSTRPAVPVSPVVPDAEAPRPAAMAESLSRKEANNCYMLFTIKNYRQALEACREPAQSGDARAQHHMASLALINRDSEAAAAWATRSANQQFAPGQLLLGNLYKEGQGVKKDNVQALKLMQQAADGGLPEALYELGMAHRQGTGAAASPARAVQYLTQAANQGHIPAHLALASLFETENQPDKALAWLVQAARKGSAKAQFRLGDIYAKGRSGAADNNEAYFWYSLALLNGENRAKPEVDRQAAFLTSAQLDAAHARIQSGLNGQWR
ncbi:MAG: sel1 repeat family protein [Gammaproteobacteria bacterium]|nr:sel1 repeat family protein [Gammaproteobacteria bacterium]MBU3990153.1 sel1 repeat family protein [Gammaproteobacteria bacterium]MBU4005627.1 sel1 repeat family protein [Gammaproteobacteria bacterium]MBU4020820.1 sel1 repeat family protein [Gammaproteobacteria bacterium]MBU4096639.1 sel1 repeat family protein [Gammaproteobacteria bacterium]